MTENPFEFGRAVEDEYFTDRIEDTKRLEANLTHGINTILISPRRWGKTSLVKKVISQSKRRDVKFIFVDVFSCKSEYEFCKVLATEIICQTSSKWEEWIKLAKTFLANITPKFSFGTDPMNDFSMSFELNPKENPEKEILQLPEKIAEKKNIQIVVCFDEFQQIADFKDSLTFQKKLRTIWQHQKHTTYCMFGSKKHLMTNLFRSAECPFYKFGDIMFLDKIPETEWVPFICEKFEKTGKHISQEQALQICQASENLSSLVQHLAWLVWYKTDSAVKDDMINSAIDELLDQNRLFYQRDLETMTVYQKNFLVAVANGVTTGLSRREILNEYHLESSANVQGINKALIARDFIDIDGDTIYFNDPFFKLWIKRNIVLL